MRVDSQHNSRVDFQENFKKVIQNFKKFEISEVKKDISYCGIFRGVSWSTRVKLRFFILTTDTIFQPQKTTRNHKSSYQTTKNDKNFIKFR